MTTGTGSPGKRRIALADSTGEDPWGVLKERTGVGRAVGGSFGMSEFVFGQDIETAASGNGGGATASANGGAVALGDINSGSNVGSAIGVGDTIGGVAVDGGAIANSTNIGVSANGGTAIADASGGDYNVAFVS